MRYFNIDNITFTTKSGQSFQVKDIREIPEYETLAIINIERGTDLDEVISRKDFYGDDKEDVSYALFDHNIVDLYESEFNVEKIKKLRIPVIEEAI